MPQKLKVNWQLAFDLFTRGLTYKDISLQLGCKEVTLRSHGARNNWSEKVAQSRLAVAEVVQNMVTRRPEALQKRAEKWVDATISDMERTVVALQALPVPDKLDGIRKHEEVWGMHVKRGRATFGLDQQTQAVQINIGLRGMGELEPGLEPAIDVVAQVLPEQGNST
jgi:hypothetical protein